MDWSPSSIETDLQFHPKDPLIEGKLKIQKDTTEVMKSEPQVMTR